MKYLAILAAAAVATCLVASEASAGHNSWKACGTYTYFKGPKSDWPEWAQMDMCAKSWKENPIVVKAK